MSYSIFDSDIVEDETTKKLQDKANMPPVATKEMAEQAAAIANRYPTLPAGAVVGAARLNISPDDPRLQQIVIQDSIIKEEEGYGALKTAGKFAKEKGKAGLRGLFLGFQSAWEEGLPEKVRYLEARQQGMSHEEATAASETELFMPALKGGDIGTGIFLGSTDPTTTDEYKNLVESGVSPADARQFVIDNILGPQIYEEQRKKAETGVQFQGERRAKFEAAGVAPTVTIGRWLFKPFDEIVEPGTKAYSYITGTIDALAQIFADPVALATFGLSKLGKAKKTFTSLEQMKKFESSGLINAARKTISGPTTKAFLAGDEGTVFKQFLWENAEDADVIIRLSKEQITDKEFFIELRKLKQNNSKKSFDEINKELTTFVDGYLNKQLITNGTLPTIVKKGNRLTKLMDKTYGPIMVTADVDGSLIQMTRMLRLATDQLDETAAREISRKYINKTLDALDSDDAPTEIVNSLVEFFQKDFRPAVVKNLGGKINRKTGEIEGLTDFQKMLVERGTSVMGKFYAEGEKAVTAGRKYSNLDLPFTGLLQKILKKKGQPVGAEETLMNPLTVSQLADEIYLPNPTDLLRVSKALDTKLGPIGQKIFTGEGVDNMRRFMDWYYGGVFKPLVLLRPAWTLRVVLEEQVRLLASGVTSITTHPIDTIARMFNNPREVQVGLLNSFENNAWHLQAMTESAGTLSSIRRRYAGAGTWGTVTKGKDFNTWKNSTFRNVMQVYFDPLSKELALIQRLPAAQRAAALRKLKKVANTQNSWLNKHIRKVTGAKTHALNGAGKNSQRGRDLTSEFINYVNANLAEVAGGVVKTTTAKGATAASSRWIQEVGNSDLLEFIARTDVDDMTGLKSVDFEKYWKGELTDTDYDRITSKLRKNQEGIKKEFFEKYLDVLPETAKAELFSDKRSIRFLNDTVDKMFDMLMSVPTNKLSRSPAFKANYWRKIGEISQHANATTLKKIIKQAKEAGIDKGTKAEKKVWKKINEYKGQKGGVNDIEIIDKAASSYALGETKRLLYDVTTRTRLGNSTRALFPFGEAFVEIFTTWGKIIKQERGRPLRRMQQVIQSGRKEGKQFEDDDQKGYFYKDPMTGQEMFNYPGPGLIRKWMFKDLEENGVKVNMPVYLQSINIAANVIPGFGPTITVPAAFLNQKFQVFKPEGVAQFLLFGEFSPPRAGTLGEVGTALIPFPSYAKKFFTAFTQNTDETKRMFNNTTIEVYKALLLTEQVSDESPAQAQKALELAADYAQNIIMFRAFAQFVGPAGPASPKYEISDKTGNFFLFETLAQEWRDISNAAPDIDAAMTEFTTRFGFDPIAIATAKTETIKKRPITADGAEWERKNKDLVEKFDLTYGFLIDETDAEFSYDAYWNQIVEGERAPRTPEQWQRAKNILKGNLEFEAWLIRNDLVNKTGKVATAAKRNKKAELASRYYGYGMAIPGSIKKPELDEMIMELYTWFNPVTYELIPELKAEPVAQALVEYIKERDKVIEVTTKMPGENYLATSFRTSAKLVPFRKHLRNVKSQILVKYPESKALLEEVFERELRTEYEDEALLEAMNE